MKKIIHLHRWPRQWRLTAVLILAVSCLGIPPADAGMRTRIVVLPFYTEQGQPADNSDGRHYRRLSGFIENHLVAHGFEVIDPFARDASEREYGRVLQRAEKDSLLVATNMCQRYAVDAVYMVWLNVKTFRTADGYTQANAIVDGKGYDSAGRSLGINLLKNIRISRRDFDEAVAVAEKEVGDMVGQALTQWDRERIKSIPPEASPGILARRIDEQSPFVTVRLEQASEYEVVEAFGKVVNTVRGVKEAKLYNQRIVPDNPQACVTEWSVEIDTRETDPFRLQANIMKMVNDILDAGGNGRIKGVPYRYTPGEIRMMMGLMPGEATTRSIQFVVNRARAREREIAARHDPSNAGIGTGPDREPVVFE